MTFIWLLTAEQIPNQLADLIMQYIHSPWMFLLTVNILYSSYLGCFMDDVSAMLVLAPLFLETLNRYGIDLVHFGIVMVLEHPDGHAYPALRIESLRLLGHHRRSPSPASLRGVMPFLVIMLLCLLLVTYVPAISLLLPNWLLH